jgi:MFS transporter, DHA1 family, tetracycline resistance protein
MLTLSYQRALLPLFLVIFIDSFGFGLVIPVMAHLLIEPNHLFFPDLSPASVNIVFTAVIALSPLAMLISHPAIGTCSDKWGRKITIGVCLIASAMGFLLPLLGIRFHLFSLIVAGRFIAGFGAGSQPIAQAAVIDASKPHHKTLHLSLIAFAMTLAMVLGPMLGGILSDPEWNSHFDNTTPFIFAFLLSLVNLFLLKRWFHETHNNAKNDHVSWRDIAKTLTKLGETAAVRRLLFVFFLYEFAWSLYFQSIPLWLMERYQLSATTLSWFLTATGFWMSLGLTLILKVLMRTFSLRTLILYNLLIAGLAVFFSSLFSIISLQWIMAIPIAIATGMIYPCLLTLLSDKSSHMKQGWVMGTASALLAGSWLISGLIASLLYNLHATLPLYFAFAAYSVAALLFSRKPAFTKGF